MTTTLGADLKSRRAASGFTQQKVADMLGVSRANVAQWESGKHAPSAERLRQLDELYGARGDLLGLRSGGPDRAVLAPGPRAPRLSDVFQDVADALVDALVTNEEGLPLGWAHDLRPDARPTPLSTAYVIRTLQRLDDNRVDMHALAKILLKRRDDDGGWTNRFVVGSRPEVTAVVITCLARLGQLPDVDAAVGHLVDSLDRFARSRPFILTAVLDALLVGHPEPAVVERVVRALLDARIEGDGPRLWAFDASAPVRRIEPNLAPTARAATLLWLARRVVGVDFRGEVEDAVDDAVRWIVGRSEPDWGTTEVLRIDVAGRQAVVPVNHFSAAWCVRLLSAVDGVPPGRLNSALAVLWQSYQPADRLWAWSSDGSLPSWMTHDAVAALRTYALTSTGTDRVALPHPRSSENHSDDSNGAG